MSQKIFTLPALIAWLEKQPGETEYDYFRERECLIGQYLQDSEIPVVAVRAWTWLDSNADSHRLPEHWPEIAAGHPRTYSAALARARALL